MTDTVGMQLLEREAPRAALAEYAADARRGGGRLVLVAGEAGVGKSALVEQFTACPVDLGRRERRPVKGEWEVGGDYKAEEEQIVELFATMATPRGARVGGAQQAGDVRDPPC